VDFRNQKCFPPKYFLAPFFAPIVVLKYGAEICYTLFSKLLAATDDRVVSLERSRVGQSRILEIKKSFRHKVDFGAKT